MNNEEQKIPAVQGQSEPIPSVVGAPVQADVGVIGISKLGKRNMAAVFLAATEEEKKAGLQGKVIEFSDQEAIVLKAFLNTHNYDAAAKEAGGITVASVKRMLRRPNLKRYLAEVIAKVAIEE